MTKGEIQSSQHQQPRAFCCLQTPVDFLPVLKGGDSLDHAVSWFKGGMGYRALPIDAQKAFVR